MDYSERIHNRLAALRTDNSARAACTDIAAEADAEIHALREAHAALCKDAELHDLALLVGRLIRRMRAARTGQGMAAGDDALEQQVIGYLRRKGLVSPLRADMRAAQEHPGAHSMEPLYDQAALDAALALWPRDCRLCAKFTTQTGGCTSTVQCVDSDQYKATAPRQYWVSGPNVAIKPRR